ncbi:hypothetical protein B0H13DRAFT_1863018 [Mycena leptocephala]|nr:hypothetical protein B0H13DRAFT_1863018 [Mycena leptocephala]
MRSIATFVLLLTSSALWEVVCDPKNTTVSARDGGFSATCGNIEMSCPDSPTGCFLYAHRCPPEQLRREPACGFRDLSALQSISADPVIFLEWRKPSVSIRRPATQGAMCGDGKGGEKYSELDLRNHGGFLDCQQLVADIGISSECMRAFARRSPA